MDSCVGLTFPLKKVESESVALVLVLKGKRLLSSLLKIFSRGNKFIGLYRTVARYPANNFAGYRISC